MNREIIKIVRDPKDDACFQITLKEMPNRFEFWRNREPQLATYKGYGRHWYKLPQFSPVQHNLTKLLKAISREPQFKHLRNNL